MVWPGPASALKHAAVHSKPDPERAVVELRALRRNSRPVLTRVDKPLQACRRGPVRASSGEHLEVQPLRWRVAWNRWGPWVRGWPGTGGAAVTLAAL